MESAGPAFDSSRISDTRSTYVAYGATIAASYRPDEHQTFSLSTDYSRSVNHNDSTAVLMSPLLAQDRAEERDSGRGTFDLHSVSIDYRGESTRPGETLTASAKWTRYIFDYGSRSTTDPAAPDETNLQFESISATDEGTIQADYVRPLGGHRQLGFGALAERQWTHQDEVANGVLPLGGSILSADTHVGARYFEHAGYATFQFVVAGVTTLAGLRMEGRSYDLAASPHGLGQSDRTFLFPSVHLERVVAPWLTTNISYSRRVDWPEAVQLDPTLVVASATNAYAGNPSLRPQFTDALEAKFVTRFGHHNLDLLLLHRITHGLFSTRSDLGSDGILVARRVNFGSQTRSGAVLSVRGPLLPHLRYTLSANLSAVHLDQESSGPILARDSTSYGGSLQLEYRDGVDGHRGADRISLNARYFGPNDTGFMRTSGIGTLGATWSHALTDRLSSVLNVGGFPPTRFRILSRSETSLVRNEIRNPASVTLALTWSLRPPSAAAH